MTRYIYKKVHIDKDNPTDTVSIPDDAIHVDVKYGVHDIPGHMTVQWLEPDPIAKKDEQDALWKAQTDEWDRMYPFKQQCMDALSENWNKTYNQQDAIHYLRISPPQRQEDVNDFIDMFNLYSPEEDTHGLEAAMLDSYDRDVNMTPLRVMIAIMLVLAALIVSFALYRSMQ